jgi:hypothetical protein
MIQLSGFLTGSQSRESYDVYVVEVKECSDYSCAFGRLFMNHIHISYQSHRKGFMIHPYEYISPDTCNHMMLYSASNELRTHIENHISISSIDS